MIVRSETVAGKLIEIREDHFGARRYWVTVDGSGLFQRGRMAMRKFATIGAAWAAGLKETR